MNTINPIVHFEMPATDRERMAEFYANSFGWRSELLGPEMNEYVLVTTSEVDEQMMPKNRGEINGGFYKKTDDLPIQGTTVVIQVDDIRESIQKVTAAGGKILGEPDMIPDVGMFVYFEDIEGNIAGMLEPPSRE